MKRYGNIYPKIWDLDNLRQAHKEARKDKSYYTEVKMVDSNPDYYLKQIQEMLKNKTYEVSSYTYKTIKDSGKQRDLAKLPYYPDRIIQWAIMLQTAPIIERSLCDWVCASLPGRGIGRCLDLLDKYLKDKENTQYCLKLDIHHFYPSINKNILKNLLRTKFKDGDLLNLLDKIIDSYEKEGIPIGSYLSQYMANFYLYKFDHYLKEELHCPYVIRYMDDVIILSSTKEKLHIVLTEITIYLEVNLNLQLKPNYQIFNVDIRGIDFIGYRSFHDYRLLRDSTKRRMIYNLLLIAEALKTESPLTARQVGQINSYNGLLKHCDSYQLRKKYLDPVWSARDQYYKEIKANETIHSNPR